MARGAQPDVRLALGGVAPPAPIGVRVEGPRVIEVEIRRVSRPGQRRLGSGDVHSDPRGGRLVAVGIGEVGRHVTDQRFDPGTSPALVEANKRHRGLRYARGAAEPLSPSYTGVTRHPGFAPRMAQERPEPGLATDPSPRGHRGAESLQAHGPLAWIERDRERAHVGVGAHAARPPHRVGPVFGVDLAPIVEQRLKNEPPRACGPVGRRRVPPADRHRRVLWQAVLGTHATSWARAALGHGHHDAKR